MSFNYKSLLPTPAQIKAEFPLTPECVELKVARDKEVADVITGKSEKFLVIIGPCSADREDAVCELQGNASSAGSGEEAEYV